MIMFNIFIVLCFLFWSQICFSDDEFPNEIPEDYEFQFFDEVKEPDGAWTDFGSGSCPDWCSRENEVQGITTIGKNYWILSKNK